MILSTLKPKTTPMMEQWESCKKQAKGALLLFRMGDFYEAFYDDAEVFAETLGLTLTKRQEIPMAGVPCHTCESYVEKLVGKGFKVAIAEQVEDAKFAKGLVRREVTRIVTPGTTTFSSSEFEKQNNFISAVTLIGQTYALAICDHSTGEFKVFETENQKDLFTELFHKRPREICVTKKFMDGHLSLFLELKVEYAPLISVQEEWNFDHRMASSALTHHFKIQGLDGFGLKGMIGAINSAGALLSYLKDELNLSVSHIQKIIPYTTKEQLVIDQSCQRNLELTESLLTDTSGTTLLKVIDHTQTPMGGRRLRSWLIAPLVDPLKIKERQEAIEALIEFRKNSLNSDSLLRCVRDLERLITRIQGNTASPRDLISLKHSLQQIPTIKENLEHLTSKLIIASLEALVDMGELTDLLEKTLVDEAPAKVSDGGFFKEGYLQELDELKEIALGGKRWLAEYQQQIRDETGIKNLKVSYNKVFGYYLEVSRGQAHLVPDTFQRRQTLVNAERFISPPLKEFESKVLVAEERILVLEKEAFADLISRIATYTHAILQIADAIGTLDALFGLAKTATINNYCRPTVDLGSKLEIIEGRHPIVELSLDRGEFVPNHTTLDGENDHLMLITGPNMAGKSTYIRQVALIVILAQMGSFVPAKEAHIGICDKLFSRIGASDDLARRQSTFMVEMSETANILNNASERSLVILDEIGRGTSTYDGVSIAWAVAEYLLTTPKKQAKTLFATHYFELTSLAENFTGATNYNVVVKECNDTIVFLHKIVRGAANRSYGIHVGKLAGLPIEVIVKASKILAALEKRKHSKHEGALLKIPGKGSREKQLSLFVQDEPEKEFSMVENELMHLELAKLTPIEALNKLYELQVQLKANGV